MVSDELKEILNDHDLLIEVNTKLSRLITDQENHLHHHWMRDLVMLSITFTSIITALVAVFVR